MLIWYSSHRKERNIGPISSSRPTPLGSLGKLSRKSLEVPGLDSMPAWAGDQRRGGRLFRVWILALGREHSSGREGRRQVRKRKEHHLQQPGELKIMVLSRNSTCRWGTYGSGRYPRVEKRDTTQQEARSWSQRSLDVHVKLVFLNFINKNSFEFPEKLRR